MRSFVQIAVVGLLTTLAAACGDNGTSAKPHDAGVEIDAAAPQAAGPCVDRPTDLARPPPGQLPCELLPPGFVPR
ncbi:MAG TPA: hypothetical protein VNO30_14910 [Kofleriaceae bacterium]|nr:hypothetical protein [Kofleriaceae bacterium]